MRGLSELEGKYLLSLADESFRVSGVEGFQTYIRDFVRPIFPHEMMVACLGAIVGGKIILESATSVDYPALLFERIHQVVNMSDRRLLTHWYVTSRPQLIVLGKDDELLSPLEREEMEIFGLRNFAAHGVVDLDGKRGSYISFANVPGVLGAHHEYLLELIAPYIHQVLVRLLHQRPGEISEAACLQLSPREMVVLRWLAEGKSNAEIAALLSRSVATIRNQVHSILIKLGAATRAEALHKAHELRLL